MLIGGQKKVSYKRVGPSAITDFPARIYVLCTLPIPRQNCHQGKTLY